MYHFVNLQWRIQDFSLGGGGTDPLSGHRPLTLALLDRNMCENERIGSHWGVLVVPPGSTNDFYISNFTVFSIS